MRFAIGILLLLVAAATLERREASDRLREDAGFRPRRPQRGSGKVFAEFARGGAMW